MTTQPTEGYEPRRIFSLKEANQALPLVMRITRDIVDSHREISDLYASFHRMSKSGKEEAAEAVREEIGELLRSVDGYIDELEKIGCLYKDPAKGLIDFPTRMGNRIVFLCWKLGEPEILYWHELQAGFKGRQPVDGRFSEV